MHEVKFFAVRATTYATSLIASILYVGISIPPGRSVNLLTRIRTGRLSSHSTEEHSHFCWCIEYVSVCHPIPNAPADEWAILLK